MSQPATCPCGSTKAFAQCCEPRLNQTSPATTAEQLMRSRYTAYVMNNEDYLLATWHESTRPTYLDLNAEPVKWLGLKIVSSRAGQQDDPQGEVEFIARYKINGKAHRLHEISRFRKESGKWFYVDGEMLG